MMRFDVITIFPEMFEAVTRHGITRRALEEGGCDFRAWNPRDFVSDPHRTVDDRPYGGGPGMVMLPGPLEDCIDCAVARQVAAGVERPQVVLLSPQGKRFTDAVARELARLPGLVLLAGRYEGVDERLIERRVDREISIGDYVTSGGELPAMVMIPGPLEQCIDAAVARQSAAGVERPQVLLLSPQGERFTYAVARQLAQSGPRSSRPRPTGTARRGGCGNQ